ncbi:MAG: hypothetical protein R2708_25890 [Vicinamibacterales bacterium]
MALGLFRDVLMKASVSIDHPRHLAFVPASPTRGRDVRPGHVRRRWHGAFWLEGAGCIFAEMQVMQWLVALTGMPAGAFGVFTSGGTEANLSAMVTAREAWRGEDAGRRTRRGIVMATTRPTPRSGPWPR